MKAWHDDRDGARLDTTAYREDRDEAIGSGSAHHVSEWADDRERRPFGFTPWPDVVGLIGEIVFEDQ